MLFDTHAHLNDPAFDPDREALISSLPEKGVSVMEATRKLHADAYHILQGMVGIHPGHPAYRTEQNLETYQKTM